MSELKSLDALRDYAEQCCPEYEPYDTEMMRIADEIQAELSERYMELPVDAGGVAIKPGDTLEYVDVENRKAIIGTVERICLDNGEVTIRFGNRPNAVFARESWKFLHVKPRTIEDVLLDAGVSRACVEDVAAELRELMGGGE